MYWLTISSTTDPQDALPLRMQPADAEYDMREALTTAAGRSMLVERFKRVLTEICNKRGVREYPRSDNGPELIAIRIDGVVGQRGTEDPSDRFGQFAAECIRGELQRDSATGVSELRSLLQRVGSVGEDTSVAAPHCPTSAWDSIATRSEQPLPRPRLLSNALVVPTTCSTSVHVTRCKALPAGYLYAPALGLIMKRDLPVLRSARARGPRRGQLRRGSQSTRLVVSKLSPV